MGWKHTVALTCGFFSSLTLIVKLVSIASIAPSIASSTMPRGRSAAKPSSVAKKAVIKAGSPTPTKRKVSAKKKMEDEEEYGFFYLIILLETNVI